MNFKNEFWKEINVAKEIKIMIMIFLWWLATRRLLEWLVANGNQNGGIHVIVANELLPKGEHIATILSV